MWLHERPIPVPEQIAITDDAWRAPEPAELGWEWHLAPSDDVRNAWRELAGRSLPLQTMIETGDATWLDTLAQLTDPFFVADRANACAFEYATAIGRDSGCAFRFRMVVERRSVTHGAIVFSAIEPASENDLAELGLTSPDPACPQYLQCLAKTRLGVEIAIPPGTWDEAAIHQSKIASWGTNVELEKMRFIASEIDAGRKKLEQEVRTPSIELRLHQLRRHAEYYRAKAARLEAKNEGEGG
jgi:hypothetical protein